VRQSHLEKPSEVALKGNTVFANDTAILKMSTNRIFNSSKFLQPTDGEPIRSVVTESKDAVVVAWYIKPGQEIAAHIHPNGQDTWTILTGKGEYYLDRAGTKKAIVAGDVVVAHTGSVHGVFNNGNEPLVFISVVSPADAGYQLVSSEDSIAIRGTN
jgi:quercetin dioxygenase-like cupin family protein